MITEIILYRNSQLPLLGSNPGNSWNWPGVAFSAATSQLYGQYCKSVQMARWVLAWSPTTTISPTGVRLIYADSGPTNVEVFSNASFLRTNLNTPVVDAADITEQFNYFIENKCHKTLGIQTVGNGSNGCKIYSSIIEVIW